MAISVSAPQIGLRLVGMADGSTAIMTERGELLARQGNITMKSEPRGPTIVNVEFVVDHDKFRIESPDQSEDSDPADKVDIPGFTANMSDLNTSEERRFWQGAAERFLEKYKACESGESPENAEEDSRKEANDRFNEASESWVIGECESFEAGRRYGYASAMSGIIDRLASTFIRKGE